MAQIQPLTHTLDPKPIHFYAEVLHICLQNYEWPLLYISWLRTITPPFNWYGRKDFSDELFKAPELMQAYMRQRAMLVLLLLLFLLRIELSRVCCSFDLQEMVNRERFLFEQLLGSLRGHISRCVCFGRPDWWSASQLLAFTCVLLSTVLSCAWSCHVRVANGACCGHCCVFGFQRTHLY